MNNYTAIVRFKGWLNEDDVRRLVLPNAELLRLPPNGSGGLRLPDGRWVSSSGDEEHTLTINFETIEINKDVYANTLKDKYLSYISLFLNTSLSGARLTEIIGPAANGGTSTTHYLTMTGNSFIVEGPKPEELILKANRSLERVMSGEDDPETTLVKMFSDAIANKDEYKKFWDLYGLLSELISTRRRRLNSSLMSEYPDDQIYHNDVKNEDTHVVVAIRDTLSHSDSTYSGEVLDVSSVIHNANNQMRRFALRLIIDRFE